MSDKKWMAPALFGALGGAVALAIFGFTWAGWQTSGKSMILADNMARKQVVAALVPVCIDQSKRDPDMAEKLTALEKAASYERNAMIMETGWATMPGTSEPNRVVGEQCMDELEKTF